MPHVVENCDAVWLQSICDITPAFNFLPQGFRKDAESMSWLLRPRICGLLVYLFGKQFTNPQAGFTKKKLMNALNVAMLSSW